MKNMVSSKLLIFCSILLKFNVATFAQEEILCTQPTDLGIVLDASDAVSSKWREVLDYANSLVDFFNVGPLKSHVGLITYGTEAQLAIDFKAFQGDDLTPENVKELIEKVAPTGGDRLIDKALQLANERLFTAEAGMRASDDTQKIIILLTAGKQTDQQGKFTSLEEASKPLQDKGIKIYVVAIGSKEDIDVDELIDIAGAKENVLTAEYFDELVALAEDVAKVACGIKIFECCG